MIKCYLIVFRKNLNLKDLRILVYVLLQKNRHPPSPAFQPMGSFEGLLASGPTILIRPWSK